MKKTLFIFLVLAPLLGLAFAAVKIYADISIWTYKGPETQFVIRSGEGFASINGRLAREKLINSAKLFHRVSQFKGVMTSFKSGEYIIKPGMNLLNIIDLFVSGQSITISVTIPEGKNLFDIGKLLQQAEITDYEEFIALAKNSDFAKELGLDGPRVEGYLFPDTYHFSKKTPAATVIRTMVNSFKSRTANVDFTHPFLKSPHEVVILASVVEKETGAAWERPLIAGVFLNRLKKPMRLQSDPTTIYGIYEGWDGNLRKRNLQETTPYNTYRINGLPKGPIANPGLEAINAVLNPEKHDYYFFVSKNDGTHIFTKTYRDHKAAVEEWQKNPANRRGRSWRDLEQAQ